jgi:hypothetical protein
MPKTAAEKLGIKPGSTVTIVNATTTATTATAATATTGTTLDTPLPAELPEDVTILLPEQADSVPDVLVLFAHDTAQLHRDAPGLLASLTDASKVWICYRKGGVSDLSRDVLMPALIDIGWHGVSLVSLDQTWSAARFRRLEHIGR